MGRRRSNKRQPPNNSSPSRQTPTRKSRRVADAEKRKETNAILEIARKDVQLIPSPNQQTRQKREDSEVDCEYNSVVRKRIAKILLDCADMDKVPCSVYGRQRYKKYPSFFFCSRCEKADREEQNRPKCYINRKTKNGRYACQAEHKNWFKPTQLDPKSKHKPEAPPSELFCVPIEERTTSSPPSKTITPSSSPKSPAPLDDFLLPKDCPQSTESPDFDTLLMRQTIEAIEDDQDRDESSCNVHSENPEDVSPDNIPDDESLDDLPPWADQDTDELDELPPFNSMEIQSDCSEPMVSSEPMASEDLSIAKDSASPLIREEREGNQDDRQKTPQVNTVHEEDCSNPNPLSPSREKSLLDRIDKLVDLLESSNNELEECKRKLKNKTEELGYWKRKDFQTKLPRSCYYPKDRKKLIEHIQYLLESRTQNMDSSSRAASECFRDVAELCLDKTVHGGLLFESAYSVFRQYVQNHIFTPYNILKKMDLLGGRLNFSGIEVLRSVETNDVPRVRTLLPSTSALQECAKAVEKFGSVLFPYKLMRNKVDGSEGFTFRASDVMSGILVASGCLYGDALWRPIRLAQSLDGALFTKNLSHTLGGLKFNDQSNSLAQSRNSVWPVVCVCRPESKGLVRSIFRNMIQEIREGARTVVPTKFRVCPLRICTNCDMSCEWKLLGRGGAAQQATFPCSKCTARSGELHLPNSKEVKQSCTLCKQLGSLEDPEIKCYHHTMCTKELLSTLEEDVKQFKKEMPNIHKNLQKVWADSKITMKVDPRSVPAGNQQSDISCIHFDLSKATPPQRQEYAKNLTNDLFARKLELRGTIEERQQRLKTSQIREWEYYQATRVIGDFNESKHSTALVYLLDTVPCILHMENRMGIKILTMCLKKGLDDAIMGDLPWLQKKLPADKRGNVGDRIQGFLQVVNETMSLHILGTVDFPTHWKVPFDETKKVISPITMDNVRIRRVLPLMDKLISVCIASKSKQQQWSTCLENYRASMEILNRKNDLSNAEIDEYQRFADRFFAAWVVLNGEHGVTNYAHLIGSGHIHEYLEHWKNLSSHAQQGWEGKCLWRDGEQLHVH